MSLWVEFWERSFLPERFSNKIKQNHEQSYTIIDANEWVCFRPPNPDLKCSIYRVKNAIDCPAPYMCFFLQFVTHSPIRITRFSCQVDVLWFSREKIKNLALFGNRIAAGFFTEGDSLRSQGPVPFPGGYSAFFLDWVGRLCWQFELVDWAAIVNACACICASTSTCASASTHLPMPTY